MCSRTAANEKVMDPKLLFVSVLVFVFQHTLGVSVDVYEGDELVVLPCQVDSSLTVHSTVVWTRKYKRYDVHRRLQTGIDDFSKQHMTYRGRTSMREDALQTGDLSLTLKEPSTGDTTTYVCTVTSNGQQLNQTEVFLYVKSGFDRPSRSPIWPALIAPIVILLVILVVIGVSYKRIHKKLNGPADCRPVVMMAIRGDTVVLPFVTVEEQLCDGVTVEWKLTTRWKKNIPVHTYHRGQFHIQGQDYQGRTQMDHDPLMTGNLSLTLRHVCTDDIGTFICDVYNESRKSLKTKMVLLTVRR
ncbi:uncharacterized protein KZ484_019592 isoform 1-T2 [Pholidichthys leucotaenia]